MLPGSRWDRNESYIFSVYELVLLWWGRSLHELCPLWSRLRHRKNKSALSTEYHWRCSEGMRLFPQLPWSWTSSGHCHWQYSHHGLLWRKLGFGCPPHFCNQGNGGSLSQQASETQHSGLSRTRWWEKLASLCLDTWMDPEVHMVWLHTVQKLSPCSQL